MLMRKALSVLLLSTAMMLTPCMFPQMQAATSAEPVRPDAVVLTANPIDLGSASSEIAAPQTVRQLAERMIRTLVDQPDFACWKEASAAYYPLGPGLHSWLVLLNCQEAPSGYLIITAVPDGGYVVSQYGTGPEVPYSQAVLRRSLAAFPAFNRASDKLLSLHITAVYADPLLPYWEVRNAEGERLFLDAMDGSMLPDQKNWPASPPTPTVSHMLGSRNFGNKMEAVSRNYQSFADPYSDLTWMHSKPIPASGTSPAVLQRLLDHHPSLVFQVSGANLRYQAPFAVQGYHKYTLDTNLTPAVYLDIGRKTFVPLAVLQASQGSWQYKPN
ncbi:hypothetical protein Q5741_06015 [Paenibacillus sp. JX-17]|uniref:Uncharacterized protein n=1 Tax=Paenibacillus lacisoli TaxID=3064525 RepID=A0ABT9C9P0_9BACL|nr:hypothetical protein [Paenibacillus sp. JX-17]MDO7905974.1 hypothetical protein [Paenibacillus sp. JX-17]